MASYGVVCSSGEFTLSWSWRSADGCISETAALLWRRRRSLLIDWSAADVQQRAEFVQCVLAGGLVRADGEAGGRTTLHEAPGRKQQPLTRPGEHRALPDAGRQAVDIQPQLLQHQVPRRV